MSSDQVKKLLVIALCLLSVSVSVSRAQESPSSIHVITNWRVRPSDQLALWLWNEQTNEMIPLMDFHNEDRVIWDWMADIDRGFLYFVRLDNAQGHVLGNNSLVRYDWKTGTEAEIYTRRNMVFISDQFERNKLIISYLPDDTDVVSMSTPVYSCLLDLETKICDELGNVITKEIPDDWIWIDNIQAIRVNAYPYEGAVELVNIETGEVQSIANIAHLGFEYGQALPDSTTILLLGWFRANWQVGSDFEYHIYRLDSQTLDTTFLASTVVPTPMTFPMYSPDGTYLAFVQRYNEEAKPETDFLEVIQVATGETIATFPLSIEGPSNESLKLKLNEFQWGANGESILGLAYAQDGQAGYIAQLDLFTNEVAFLSTVEEDLSFAVYEIGHYGTRH